MSRLTNTATCASRILSVLDRALGAPVTAATLRVLKSEDWNRAALLAKHWSGVPSFTTRAVVVALAESREQQNRKAVA